MLETGEGELGIAINFNKALAEKQKEKNSRLCKYRFDKSFNFVNGSLNINSYGGGCYFETIFIYSCLKYWFSGFKSESKYFLMTLSRRRYHTHS